MRLLLTALVAALLPACSGNVYYQQAPSPSLSSQCLVTPVLVPGVSFTVSLWVKPDMGALYPANITVPAVLFGLPASASSLLWQPSGNSSLQLILSGTTVTAPLSLPMDGWSYLVAAFDFGLGDVTIYFNGQALNLATPYVKNIDTYQPVDSTLVIGNYDALGSSNAWPGAIDDVSIFNGQLGPDDVALLFTTLRPDQLNNQPLAFYSFDDSAVGSIMVDINDVSVNQQTILLINNTNPGSILSDLTTAPPPTRGYSSAVSLTSTEVCLMQRVTDNWQAATSSSTSPVTVALMSATVQMEQDRAIGVEQTLNYSVQSEVIRATDAEETITAALNVAVQRSTLMDAQIIAWVQYLSQAAINSTTDLEDSLANTQALLNTTVLGLNSLTAVLNASILQLNASVQAESSRATLAEVSLSQSAAHESQNRINADASLQNQVTALMQNIADMISSESAHSAALNASLLAEINRAQLAEQSETNRAQSAEATLRGNLEAESQTRAAADALIITQLSAAEINLNASLTAESVRAIAAEGALAANLEVEVTRAQSVDGELRANLLIETQSRLNTTAQLTAQVRLNFTLLDAALSAETNRAETAESSELSRALAAEDELQVSIQVETSRASSAESVLTLAGESESLRARAAEAQLLRGLQNETQARTIADTTLQNELTAAAQTLNSLISAETLRATQVAATLNASLLAEVNRANKSELAETARAEQAERNLNQSLIQLIGQLTDDLAQERINRIAMDSFLSASINNLTQALQNESNTRSLQMAALSSRVSLLEARVPNFITACMGTTKTALRQSPFGLGPVTTNQVLPFDTLLLQQPSNTTANAPSVVFDAAHNRVQLRTPGWYRLDALVRVVDPVGGAVMAAVAWVLENSVQPLVPAQAGSVGLGDASSVTIMLQVSAPINVQVMLVSTDNSIQYLGDTGNRYFTPASSIVVTRLFD